MFSAYRRRSLPPVLAASRAGNRPEAACNTCPRTIRNRSRSRPPDMAAVGTLADSCFAYPLSGLRSPSERIPGQPGFGRLRRRPAHIGVWQYAHRHAASAEASLLTFPVTACHAVIPHTIINGSLPGAAVNPPTWIVFVAPVYERIADRWFSNAPSVGIRTPPL